MYLLAICMCFWKNVCSDLSIFKKNYYYYLLLSCMCSLYILDISF